MNFASHPRILVVDPKPSNLAVLVRRLGAEGYRVTTAVDGMAALAAMHRAPADLILAEFSMTPMSGVALTQAVRGQAGWRDLPVILITGRSETGGVVRALEGGADDVVVKPFHFEVLAARIARQLQRADGLRQLRADMAAMDARVAERAIELGELKHRMLESTSPQP
ncbi:MAG TPA: response regulator [Sphingomicrobium sp.]|jgi:DNA-binding response OmpR family regulator|nr:response regulator [Sphingomicrobium sp.]